MELGIKKAEEIGTGRITVLWDREGLYYFILISAYLNIKHKILSINSGFTRKNFDKSMLDLFKKLISIL